MASSWLNPFVARLVSGEELEGQYCGLLVICSWPMPSPVVEQLLAFREALRQQAERMPEAAYVYPATTLHCTVATLRPFTAGPLTGRALEDELERWRPVLAAARDDPEWPAGAFKLHMQQPTFEGSSAILKYEDCDGAIRRMRFALRRAIEKAGGIAAEGSSDRSLAKPLIGCPPGTPAPHLPDIVHSTVLRWSAEVPEEKRASARAAFACAASRVTPVTFIVKSGIVAVTEDVPFMHIRPEDATQKVWWRA